MDSSVTFGRHLARLMWALVHEPANVDEQKVALRALVTLARDGAVALTVDGDGIDANGQRVPPVFTGVDVLRQRLAVHGASALRVPAGVAAGEILGAARFLAAEPVGGKSPRDALRASGVEAIELASVGAGLGDFDIVSDDAIAAVVEQRRSRPAVPRPAGTEPAGADDGLFTQFASTRDRSGTPALLMELAAATDDVALGVLDRVALAAEQAQRNGQSQELLMLFTSVIRRADRAAPEWQRQFALARKRVVTDYGLRLVAGLLPRRIVPREDVEYVIARMGEDGADAVIELLTQASAAADRRAYCDLLLTLRAGIPTLTHMLGDGRWFVARNAAELLGEMGIREAERGITGLLRHEDARVRVAALGALLQLGTDSAAAAVDAVLRADAPGMRLEAVTAVAGRRNPRAAAALLRALAREEDEDVQRAIYTALGKAPTPAGVERLIQAAAPAGGLFKRKSTDLRIVAVTALGTAGTAEAHAALRLLAEDRDRTVRECAVRALANGSPAAAGPG